MVGDGFSDLQVAKAGVARTFVAYTGSVVRPEVVGQADFVVYNFKELVELLRELR